MDLCLNTMHLAQALWVKTVAKLRLFHFPPAWLYQNSSQWLNSSQLELIWYVIFACYHLISLELRACNVYESDEMWWCISYKRWAQRVYGCDSSYVVCSMQYVVVIKLLDNHWTLLTFTISISLSLSLSKAYIQHFSAFQPQTCSWECHVLPHRCWNDTEMHWILMYYWKVEAV